MLLLLKKDDFIFRGFNGRFVAKYPERTTPLVPAIKYEQYIRYLSLWFGCIIGIIPEEFKNQHGSQSGRICSASTTSNAYIPVEIWS